MPFKDFEDRKWVHKHILPHFRRGQELQIQSSSSLHKFYPLKAILLWWEGAMGRSEDIFDSVLEYFLLSRKASN